jgi:DNA-binding transcriptional ArsR family regulator
MTRIIPAVRSSLSAVLTTLSDPVRLEIVRELAKGERACGSFDVAVSQATISHHLTVLREAGVVGTRADGKQRINFLRIAEMKRDFPGRLNAILKSRAPL